VPAGSAVAVIPGGLTAGAVLDIVSLCGTVPEAGITMTSRDLVLSTLNHQPTNRAPRDLWYVGGVERLRPDDVAEIEVRYPKDIVRPDFEYPPGKRSKGKPNRAGLYTDAWGCTWQVFQRDAVGQIKDHPLADAARIAEYRPPFELLGGDRHAQARLDRANRSCATTSRFVLAWTQTRPFERLQSLRGPAAALADLEAGTREIRALLGMLHDFSCREMEMWAGTDVDGVAFGDDWGSEQSLLLLPPEVWRGLFRPMYREYCKILHAKDKFAFFSSAGEISRILGDLVRIDVDAVNSELLLADVERLAKRYRGRVTFWGEIDWRKVLPSGSVEEVQEAVKRVRRALDFGSGGVIAQCRWTPETPLRNVAAAFEQWLTPLPMHG
jgi:uroporphyrinogen decarboxylase